MLFVAYSTLFMHPKMGSYCTPLRRSTLLVGPRFSVFATHWRQRYRYVDLVILPRQIGRMRFAFWPFCSSNFCWTFGSLQNVFILLNWKEVSLSLYRMLWERDSICRADRLMNTQAPISSNFKDPEHVDRLWMTAFHQPLLYFDIDPNGSLAKSEVSRQLCNDGCGWFSDASGVQQDFPHRSWPLAVTGKRIKRIQRRND